MTLTTPHRWFFAGCLLEGSLLLVAMVLGRLLGQPALATLHWRGTDFLWGLIAVLPMALVFWWMLRSSWRALAEIRAFLDQHVRPVLGQWSVTQLLVVSLIAGVAEESLFRAVLQGGLAQYLTPGGGLAVASVLFGLGHAVTRTYAVIAALIGLYLGLLWLWTGNLLAPVVAHAVYDFAALVYFLKRR